MRMLNIYIIVPVQCMDHDYQGEVTANSQRIMNDDEDDVKVLFFQHNE